MRWEIFDQRNVNVKNMKVFQIFIVYTVLNPQVKKLLKWDNAPYGYKKGSL